MRGKQIYTYNTPICVAYDSSAQTRACATQRRASNTHTDAPTTQVLSKALLAPHALCVVTLKGAPGYSADAVDAAYAPLLSRFSQVE